MLESSWGCLSVIGVSTRIGIEGSIALGGSLVEHPNLTELIICNSNISCKGVANILCNLRKMYRDDLNDVIAPEDINLPRALKTLELAGNEIGVRGLEVVAIALGKECAALEHLDLSNNRFTKESLKPIFDALRENKKLKTLNLSRTIGIDYEPPLTESQVREMFDGLKKNTTLTHLNISGIFGSEILIALADAIESNTTLVHLDLGAKIFSPQSAIGEAAFRRITAFIARNVEIAATEDRGLSIAGTGSAFRPSVPAGAGVGVGAGDGASGNPTITPSGVIVAIRPVDTLRRREPKAKGCNIL